MKKFVITIVLFLLGVVVFSQDKHIGTSTQILVDRNNHVYDWTLYGDKCFGCSSFYIKITRTDNPVNGVHVYFVLFYSNSFDNYGYLSSTYIKEIRVKLKTQNGNTVQTAYLDYLLIKPKTKSFNGVNVGIRFVSQRADDVVVMSWKSSTVY